MSTITDIGTLITRNLGIHGGCPIIAGTGVTVRRIAAHYKMGLSAEEIAAEIPHLTLTQIYAALAYYHAHRNQIEADILAYYEECDRLEAEYKAGKL